GIHVAPIEMARHVEVIKLVPEVPVVPDTGEDMQQELGRAQANQNSNCERRKRRYLHSLAIGVRLRRASDSHTRIVLLTRSVAIVVSVFLFLSQHSFRMSWQNPAE